MQLYRHPVIYDLVTCWGEQRLASLIADAVPRGSKVLDLGIGSGRMSRVLEGFDYSFAGIEISQAMVELLSRTMPHVQVVHGSFTEDRAYEPFAASSFDAVLCVCNTLLYAESREALSRTLRLARGRVVSAAKFIVQTTLNVTDATIGKSKTWDTKVRVRGSFERVIRTTWHHRRNFGPHVEYKSTVSVREAGLQTFHLQSEHKQLRLSASEMVDDFAAAGWRLRRTFDGSLRNINIIPVATDTYVMEFEADAAE